MMMKEMITKEKLDSYFSYTDVKIKTITVEEFAEIHPIFKYILLNSINRFTNKIICQQLKEENGNTREYIHLFSEKHYYRISVVKNEYIGAIMNNRFCYVFETHHRGADLFDGEYNNETIVRILSDIISYELIPLDVYKNCFE